MFLEQSPTIREAPPITPKQAEASAITKQTCAELAEVSDNAKQACAELAEASEDTKQPCAELAEATGGESNIKTVH